MDGNGHVQPRSRASMLCVQVRCLCPHPEDGKGQRMLAVGTPGVGCNICSWTTARVAYFRVFEDDSVLFARCMVFRIVTVEAGLTVTGGLMALYVLSYVLGLPRGCAGFL
jgi:hypothetical protein